MTSDPSKDEGVWPAGLGEMAGRIREHDWSATPLGALESWPQSLRTAVDICLGSGFGSDVYWGPELILIYNDAARPLHGTKHPAALARPGQEVWAEAWSEVGPPLDQVLNAGKAILAKNLRLPVLRSEAIEEAWFTLSYSPLRDEEGRVAGVFVTAIETTTRVLADAALRKSEERYRAFVTASFDIVYRMSPDWSEMRQLDGRSFLSDTREPNSAWLDHYIHRDDQREVRDAIERAIRTRSTFELEHRVLRADGTLGWTLSRAVPILDEEGNIAEWLGAASDVTPRKEAELALRDSEARYRTLFESMDEGFCTVEVLFDPQNRPVNYRFLEVNPAFERHTGLVDAVGRTMLDLAPKHEEHWFETYGRIALTGEPARFENKAEALGRWYEVYAFRIGEPKQRRVAILFSDITARKHAEEALRGSEERLRRVFETEAVGVLFFRDGVLIGANDVFLRMTGWSREEVDSGSLTWRSMTPSEWMGESEAQMQRLGETGRVGPYEKEYIRKDGSRSWMLFAGRDLGDGTMVEFGIDIEDRKRAEAALRESEARLSAAFESVPVGVAVSDMTGTAVIANEEYRRFLPNGVIPSRDPARVGRWRAWDAEGQPIEPRDFPGARALRGDRVVPGQEMLFTDDEGREIWTSVASVPIRDANGQVTGLAAVISDIDARKRSVEALRASEERFRSFAENSADTLWIVGADTGRLEYLSPAFEAMWGESRDAVMADLDRWSDLLHPEDRARAKEGMPRLAAGEAYQQEYRIVRPSDGAVRWIQDTGFPIRDASGRVTRVAGIAQDTTERRNAEDRQKMLLGELQHRVRNTLAVIRSIARRSAETSETVEDYAMHLDGRIDAFARVQAAMVRDPSSGIDLEHLVAAELLAYAAQEGDQVERIKGPKVRLQPKAAETIALAIHELATNAVKYGALSAKKGRVEVGWTLEKADGQARLLFHWTEKGVKLSGEEPKRRGFGTELIERTLEYELGGEASLWFSPHGLRCTISLPVDDQLLVRAEPDPP